MPRKLTWEKPKLQKKLKSVKKNKSFSCVFAKLCESTDMTAKNTDMKEATILICDTANGFIEKGTFTRETFNQKVKGKTSQEVVLDILKINKTLNTDDAARGKHIVDDLQSINKAVLLYFQNND